MSNTKNAVGNSENAWRDGRVFNEKRGISGDVIALIVDHLPPGPGSARSRFRITRGTGGADGIENVLLSEDFYAIAQFDANGYLEVLFDVVLAKFETTFKHQLALMDADDTACAIDMVLSESVSPHDVNTKA